MLAEIAGKLLVAVMVVLTVGAVPVYARETSLQKLGQGAKGLMGSRAVIGQGVVQSKSDTSLTVSSGSTTYMVNMGTNTVIRRKFGAKSSLAEISVGDTVNVIGKFTSDTKTITARTIRDLSLQTRRATFVGKISSLTDGGFVMTTAMSINRPSQAVTISSTTQIVDRKNAVLSSGDLKVGDKVSVKGMWNNTGNTLTEVTKIKDFSVPAK